MSPAAALSQALRAKGWTMRDAAQYLGISRQHLYNVAASNARPRLWDCAVAGMPECTPQIRAELAASRKAMVKPKPATKAPG